MLQVTGKLNGKNVKNELVSPDELIQMVKGESEEKGKGMAQAMKKKVVYVTYPKSRMEYDPLNNNIRKPTSCAIQPEATIRTKEGILKVRYYTGTHETDKGITQYEPSSIKIMSETHTKGYNPKADPELMAYLLLSPKNLISPFCENESNALFTISDPEAEAIAKNMQEFKFLETMNKVQELAKESPNLLRRKALGLNINGLTVPNSEMIMDSSDMIIAEMMKIARAYPAEFASKFEQASTMLRGLVVEAFDKGILKANYESNQVVIKQGDSEVTRFSKNTDPATGFLTFIETDDIAKWNKSLSTLVDGDNLDAKLNKALASKK